MHVRTQLLSAAIALFVIVSPVSAQQTPAPSEPAPQISPSPIPSETPTPPPAPAKPLKPAKKIDSLGDFAIAPSDQPAGCNANRFYSAEGDGGRIVCDSQATVERSFIFSSRLKVQCEDQTISQVKKRVCIVTD